MKMIMARLHRFGRFRQLHTIISQETVKPSSPAPPHLKTHNLSLVDRFAPNIHMPLVFFYQNYKNADINNLKKSLSQCLTCYYPFAGRLSHSADHIECNDEGVEFLEASQDSRLEDFIFKKEQPEIIYQLIPNGLGCVVGKSSPKLVEVQLSHFKIPTQDSRLEVQLVEASQDSRLEDFIFKKEQPEIIYQLIPNGLGCVVGKSSPKLVEVQLSHFNGGGVAVAVSISHKVADGFTMANFINQWATISRGDTPIIPNFISLSTNNSTIIPEFVLNSMNEVKYVTRMFVFPNSKLDELKKKVSAMGTSPMNPTRVEVLTSLIFKCEVDAATTKSGFLNPSNLLHTVNMRNKIIQNDPEKAAGNIFTSVIIKTTKPREIMLNEVVAKLRKEKKELKGIRDIQEVGEHLVNVLSMVGSDQVYTSSSVCGFPFYDVDFGWGKPVEVTLAGPNTENKALYLMDTPNKDGILAIVHLPEDEMLIFQENEELLAYDNNHCV